MKKNKKNERNRKIFVCKCGCESKLFVNSWQINNVIIGSGLGKTATWNDNLGVILNKKDVKKLIKLLKSYL